MKDLNKIIHQPIRTQIMTLLASEGEVEYTKIKSTFSLSDGHMSTHMKKLVEAEYVNINKQFENNKPVTRYSLTEKGRSDFLEYLSELQSIINTLA